MGWHPNEAGGTYASYIDLPSPRRRNVKLSGPADDVVTPPNEFFTVHEYDARRLDHLLRPFSSATKPLLTCTITSPPYGELKDYRHPDQIGWGQTHEEYLVECRRVFRTVHKHTKDDGSLWIIADTLRTRDPNGTRLQPLPFDLAAQAEEAGWFLRDVIIWKKDKTLPWSGRGRLRNIFEYILFLVKTDDFKYRIDRLREPENLEEWWVKWPERYNPQGKVPSNVWEHAIPVQGSWKTAAIQHACPLPPDLVERLIFLSSDPGDVVFDPFAGTGVVVAEAHRLGRLGVGTEIVKKYVKAFRRHVKPQITHERGEDNVAQMGEKTQWLQDTILKLRCVKYPKVLLKELARARPDLPQPVMAAVLVGSLDGQTLPQAHKLVDASLLFLSTSASDTRDEIERLIKNLSTQQPASKFGITGDIAVATPADIEVRLRGRRLFLYEDGRTWAASTEITADEAIYLTMWPANRTFPPIVADVFVRETPRPLRLNPGIS